jgi:hypothetical protein
MSTDQQARGGQNMSPEEKASLDYLLDRRKIDDLLARYTRGVDRLDRELLASVYHPDALDDHGCFVGARDEFIDYVMEMHSTHHHSTMHFAGSTTVDIDGDTAHAETYYLFCSMNKAGQPFTFVGGRYFDRLEKLDGEWLIRHRKCLTDWVAPSINDRPASKTPEGRANFLHMAEHEWEATRNGSWPRRDQTDPRYERPLTVSPDRVAEFQSLLEKYGARRG